MVETWFAIFWGMIAAYAILDGRTLGAGMLRLMVSWSQDDRRQVLDAIGPIWTLYEVWLVGAGGVLLLAFPPVLAAAFSGYYLALFLILWLLVLRGMAIELGRHLEHPLWNSFWDFVLSAASAVMILLLGVALGNIVRGVPLDERGEFHMAFFTDFGVRGNVGLLDWFTLTVGAFALAGLGAHGATYLTCRTTGIVRDRSKRAATLLWCVALGMGIAVAVETRFVRPDLWPEIWSRPLSIACLLIAVGGPVAVFRGFRANRDGLSFGGSCALIAAIVGGHAAASFPVILHSTFNPEHSLSAFQTASRHNSLVFGLAWWLIAAPLAILWHILAERGFRGRVEPAP
jgi:cytochrome d ubiquinol oxidase subunit II